MDDNAFRAWVSEKRSKPLPSMPALPLTLDLHDYPATMQRLGLVATSSSMDSEGRVTVKAHRMEAK